MILPQRHLLSRRHFCLCCIAGATFAATKGWLTPRQAFAEARGLVSLIKDSAAVSPIVTHRLRNNVSVLEGSGGNIAVLTGPDGKVLIDAGIGVSRPQITKALAELGDDPVTHLINTHWHFDHADGNEWLHSVGAKIIAQENTRKHLSGVQRVEDWDYNFLPPPPGALPSEVFATERSMKLNGASIALKHYAPAHTDSDISVTFGEADIVHVGDTFWNGIYPFIDYSTGGSIDGMIAASDANLRRRQIERSSFRATVSRSATGPSSRNSARCSSPSVTTSRSSSGKDDRATRRSRQSPPPPSMQVGQFRHRPRFFHSAGLRGRLTYGAIAQDHGQTPQPGPTEMISAELGRRRTFRLESTEGELK